MSTSQECSSKYHRLNRHKHKWATTLSKHHSIPLPSYLNKNDSQNDTSKFYRKNWKYIALSFLILLVVIIPAIYTTYLRKYQEADDSLSCNHRSLLSLNDDCFQKAADPGWLAIFCFLGTLYMFVALSIIVDEFFVPSLETISLKLQISNDVAGATLMAAGGSAPELFTSLIGTFQETDVGFAAIVGSAVFNVLFVIGICAFTAPEPLKLTWWPLFRDCIYYAFGLGVLSLFFIGISSRKIEWYESLILFILYIGYVIYMKYNEQILEFIQTNIIEKRKSYILKQKTLQRSPTKQVMQDLAGLLDQNRVRSVCLNPVEVRKDTTFRSGMINILLKDKWDWNDVVSISVVNSISGDVQETFNKLDQDNNGYLDMHELGALLKGLHADIELNPIEDLMKQLDLNGDGKLSFQEFSTWYISSEERILGELKYIFKLIDKDQSNHLTVSEVRAFLLTINVNLTHEEITEIFKENNIDISVNDDENADVDVMGKKVTKGMTFEQFRTWFISTEFYQNKLECFTKQAACVESTKIENILAFPETFMARFWFIITIPLIILLVFTIPDVRKPGLAKYCYASFFISILWVGVFSYFLVEWTSILGDTLRIPLVVMGLTFLAAGTSIPDLLSSVIVAKQGHGDMAVSSSIGSNIFDILVGLPIPWLLYSIYKGGNPVIVNADGLEISVLILLAMLVLIVIIIKLCDWIMTKRLGVIMMVLYVAFVAQDLARADWTC